MALNDITEEIIAFRDARDWGKYHTARNLALAIGVEVGELQEAFLWDRLTPTELWERAVPELADVLIYALLMCRSMGVEPEGIIRRKLDQNARKYPVDTYRGTARRPEDY